MKHLFPIPIVVTLLGAGPAIGQGHVHPPPGEKLGTVHFETSCAAAAQPAFDRAVSLLHSNRFLYRAEVTPAGKTMPVKLYQVGATKEGEAFAGGSSGPECIVSGGLGTMKVSYKGKTYYVCCSGCRDEFNANAARYVKEYEAKLKSKKK